MRCSGSALQRKSLASRKGNADKGSGGVTTADRSGKRMETTGIEPATSWLQTRCSSIASENQSRLTTTEPERCTKCCTAPAGDQLAEFVHSLTPEHARGCLIYLLDSVPIGASSCELAQKAAIQTMSPRTF